MKTAVITGANRGIGLQTARELGCRGFRIFLGTRNPAVSGQRVTDLECDARWLPIDVAQPNSIRSAAQSLIDSDEIVDVLINNAGVYPDNGRTILNTSRKQFLDTFEVNTLGAVEVTQSMLPLLKRSPSARVINVSSGYGAIDGMSAHVPTYCLSKLALNGATKMLAEELASHNIAVNSVCPGWVRTDMGGTDATRSVKEGAAGIVWLADEAVHDLTGKFFRDGAEIAW